MHYETLRILVVDDHHHTCVLIGEVLRAIGVRQVHEAHDGHQALVLLRTHEVDLILTDLEMPVMDGLEFIQKLRAETQNPNRKVPIVVVSGHSTAAYVRRARDAGANEFLTKPITARAVIDHVHEVMEHERPFIETADYVGPDRRRHHDVDHQGPWRRAGDHPAPTPPQQKAAEDET